ncbi:hypothetical protein D16iCDA_15670 [Pseudomonas seleniipraecipitans]|uniref:Uncharacterized protein n=1 Tax=Phytopseudomonas seleniipraecipitans TaxID=640205 RepID=A0ABY5J676_9GAMM|nr:hypothetical protein [Pseudomonas seleniipraecipitans]UUD63125.1 hypothetical protein D16iCDA_15670 [Pseudomonas seleniipraecipitans]
MTAEIAIMSRTAVVLAADSAVTVSYWKEGYQQRRYFKGVNKLFELARSGPVGLMIYGSASLQGVPWELAIKSFRESIGDTQYDSLETYPERFIEYVQHNDKLFTDDAKLKALVSLVGASHFRLQAMVARFAGEEELISMESKTDEQIEAALTQAEQEISSVALPDLLTEADIANAAAKTAGVLSAEAPHSVLIFMQQESRAYLIPRFVAAMAELAVKEFFGYADETGIVIAGYGKEDYFPALEEYICYGFLGDRLIVRREEPRVMDANAPAVIQPFATTHMIDTFRTGVAPDVLSNTLESTRQALGDLGLRVMEECGAQTPLSTDRLEEMVSIAHKEHTDRWYREIRNQHVFPLSNIIHSLPLPDMAGLAKSLIELESLKERVTKPSESVSGPIDVAVISKHDGFVWIDRKHYFRPELNPRYFKRAE